MYKKFFIALAVVFMFVCGVSSIERICNTTVHAEESIFPVEQYTDDDYLLMADGKKSTKNILDFASEVKGDKYTYYPELAEVIPRQYLESQEKKATFAYNGKEYGFYVSKNDDVFNVLLIDFKYEFYDESDLEYKIKILPILQQNFVRTTDDSGAYTWKKTTSAATYYVGNPRFLSEVKNENALNYGDEGYSKILDDGTIIQQSRTNYGKISYAKGSDLLWTTAAFAGERVLGMVSPQAAGVASYIKFASDVYNAGKEVSIEANNEVNIFTRQSKTAQRDNPDIDGYSRVAGFMPTEEIVLSADEDSYAEFITVLNDANSRTRLNQYCEFDIYYRNSGLSSMTVVQEGCCFSKESTLYDDKSITPLNDVVSQDTYAYILDRGCHRFSYSCSDTTAYRIIFNGESTSLSVTSGDENIDVLKISDSEYEVFLTKGKDYIITFGKDTAGIFNFTFCKKAESVDVFGDKEIKALDVWESKWFTFIPTEEIYLSVDYDATKYEVFIYHMLPDENLKINSVTNHIEFLALKNRKYYIRIANVAETACPAGTVFIGDVPELAFDKTVEFSVDGERVYRFNAPVDGRYKIADLPQGITADFDSGRISDAFLLSAGEHYVTLYGRLAMGSCKIIFDYNEIYTHGDVPATLAGMAPCIILKYKAPQSLEYTLSVSDGTAAEQVFNGVPSVINDVNSISLEKGNIYYFIIRTDAGDLPSALKVAIYPTFIDEITANADGDVETTIDGNGDCVLKVNITDDNYYDFIGVDDYVLYDSVLDEVGRDSLLTAGIYFIKTNIDDSRVITVSRVGLLMSVGDTIVVNGARVFKYNLIKGEKYEVRIGKNSNNTFIADIVIFDSIGGRHPVEKVGDVYCFTAEDDIIYVKLLMENAGGQAGVFFLTKANMTEESSVLNVQPEHIYSRVIADNRFIKIPAGKYFLYITKSVRESVCLYEIKDGETPELVN